MPRYPGSGLTTLAGVLLLAVLTLTLQTRTTADLRLLARLTDDLETRAAKDSLHDRLRPLIVEAMAGTPDAQLKLDSAAWS
jgi:HAMP domain-containing protein